MSAMLSFSAFVSLWRGKKGAGQGILSSASFDSNLIHDGEYDDCKRARSRFGAGSHNLVRRPRLTHTATSLALALQPTFCFSYQVKPRARIDKHLQFAVLILPDYSTTRTARPTRSLPKLLPGRSVLSNRLALYDLAP